MRWVAVLLCCCALPGWAEDMSLADGTVLHEVVVTGRGVDYLQVRHSSGACRVYYQNMTSELQGRFQMTPEDVEARQSEVKQQADERRKEKREANARRRELLKEAGLQPRYLTGSEVLQLLSPLDVVGSREAEYLAVEWNRREALRMGLDGEAERFAGDARVLRGAFEADRRSFLAQYRDTQKAREKVSALHAQLDAAEKQVKRLQDENAALRQEPLYTNPSATVVLPVRPSVLMVHPAKPMPPPFHPVGRPLLPGGIQARPALFSGKVRPPGGRIQSNFRS